MNTFQCSCGNALFLDSTQCVQCEKPTTLCPVCQEVTAWEANGDNLGICGNIQCQAQLKLCANYRNFGVCNNSISVDEVEETLCSHCRLTTVIPDFDVEGNLEKWSRLEWAKHRVLYAIEKIGLPIGTPENHWVPKLSFEFKADREKPGKDKKKAEPIATGHANGCITINLKEADSVKREIARVEFGEPQRTLVGHFRHELGHYYWDLLVNPTRLEKFRKLFGNETSPPYADAMDAYYENGPLPNWQNSFISAYATMHPWEDFAETFAAYLDMVAVLMTSEDFDLTTDANNVIDGNDFDAMVNEYSRVGILANELNREMGLIDLVPEVYSRPVIEKLRFVHELR
ncbi:zinc-binding metallopeptidase family protein [Adhaeretor mobilis]|uniref:Zinc-ribbon domain-containing protein n=1 Tax=Adhaeretor mobilis TaxID=1930276 RepID=A0A517MUV2_9BACT|nr:putative zinc-binding metallopeptidase [Adhaeretor mobilis]QDS98649.1 hypothetical protein HG15A2_19300 [Adhaeretor mobilis]